jgi:hypothetical protein
MNRLQFTTLACALTAGLALSACKRQDSDSTAPPGSTGSTGSTTSPGTSSGSMSSGSTSGSMSASSPASAASQ